MEWLTPPLFITASGIIIALLGRIIHQYTGLQTRLRELEIRVQMVERQDDRILAKLDKMDDKLQEINLTLTDKQDRAK